jgi:hypothetical protein
VKVIVKLNGMGGELDRVEIQDAGDEGTLRVDHTITKAVLALVMRCTLAVGDTITITEED